MLWVVRSILPNIGYVDWRTLVEADTKVDAIDIAWRWHQHRQREQGKAVVWGVLTELEAKPVRPVTWADLERVQQ